MSYPHVSTEYHLCQRNTVAVISQTDHEIVRALTAPNILPSLQTRQDTQKRRGRFSAPFKLFKKKSPLQGELNTVTSAIPSSPGQLLGKINTIDRFQPHP